MDRYIFTWLICLFITLQYKVSNPISIHNPKLSPGHMKALATDREKRPVEVVLYYPEPEEFFINYVDKKKPALFRGVAKLSPAFEKWSEEYFRKNPKMADYSVVVEPKKENMSMLDETQKRMPFKDFISKYRSDDLAIASSVPRPLQKDILIPSVLRCKETADKLYDTALWYSNGGTQSALHAEQQDEINCLFRGRKDYLLLDHQIYKDKVQIDRGNGDYVNVDVDQVDFSRYPELEDVEWQYAAVTSGDCLYIPYKWIQQTNSYPNDKGEAIAVNFLFEHVHDHRPRSCSIDPNKATVDRFKFQFLENEERNMKRMEDMDRKRKERLAAKGTATEVEDAEEQDINYDGEEEDDGHKREIDSLDHFTKYLQFKPSHTINFPQFLDILKKDENLSHFKINTGIQFPKSFIDPAKNVFSALDGNIDGLLTQEDFTKHSKKPKKDLQEFISMLDSHIQYLTLYVEDLVEAKYHGETINEIEERQIEKMKELRDKLTLRNPR